MTTYAELRGGVDELEGDLLEVPAGGVDHERLADGDDALLGTRDGALEHQVVVLDDTVVREATHGRNGLLRDIVFRRGVGLVGATANTVDLLVELRTVVVAVYTSRLACGSTTKLSYHIL